MRTHVLALLAALLLLLGIGAGTAAAQAPTQVAGQDSGSQQSANSEANAAQVAPSNRNVDVRIFSPGNSGAVEQTNAAGAASAAGNANSTDQSASQAQPGAGTQAVGQSASNDQDANAEANAVQVKPSNDNIVVRIDSPGSDGPVEQTNAAGALAAAGNDNSTSQAADQQQGGSGCCKGGGGTQVADQKAHNDQSADAKANAEQIKPSNKNVNVRIGSPGNNGSVTQTNAALAGALAGNSNATTQSADQSQDGGCKCGGGGAQVADQKAKNKQSADADANAKQIHPSNNNTSVRIDSPGNDGPVKQTNLALADALAGNENSTDQTADQSQGGGGGTQVAGQHAYNDQYADADANAFQIKPSNDNTAVRIGSPGSSGSVTQTNAALAGALAGNSNETTQSADQSQAGDSCKCHGGGLQVAEQKAGSKQDAYADANAFQFKPSNSNTAVDIGGHKKKCGCPDDHKGGGGDVTQTNAAAALGIALNKNSTDQSVTQYQDGSCKCSDGVQAAGQFAFNDQYADADANAVQVKPSNSNTSVGGSGGGDVTQTNAALAAAIAANLNATTQSVDQSGGGVQAVGQKAASKQGADADGNAFQFGAYNGNTPVDLGGHKKKCGCPDDHKGGGDVTQTNAAAALGVALNKNRTDQSVTQYQDGSCKCSDGVQAVGQHAFNDQYADADANAVQVKPSNSNTSVGGSGGGDVTQTNAALSAAIAANLNATTQYVDQSGGGVQAVGQKAASKQDAYADSNAFQFKPSNSNTAVDLGGHKKKCGCPDDHKGGGGDVTQTNLAASLGIAANANSTDQSVTQSQYDHGCKCYGDGVQAAGQFAFNDQYADADANAVQVKPSNSNTSVGGSGGGDVTQTNAALAAAIAANLNEATQSVDQSGGGIQVAEQKAASKQYADADANAIQFKPSNSNTAVDLGGGKKHCGCPDDHKGGGGGGDVTQTNAAAALGIAANANSTDQWARQYSAGDACKCHGGGLQVVKQDAYNDQYADADANAIQVKPSNDNTSVGGSGGGDVTQTNAALAAAIGVNLNQLTQSADQSGGAGGVQAIYQKAASKQDADADANAIQFKPSNSNTVVDLGGGKKHCGCPDDHKGGGGDVEQTNLAAALGIALNANSTDQSATQYAAGDACKCYGGGSQAAYQKAFNYQDADADANAFQLGASNSNTPVSLWGAGGSGSVRQLNAALALALAANLNRTDQEVVQQA